MKSNVSLIYVTHSAKVINVTMIVLLVRIKIFNVLKILKHKICVNRTKIVFGIMINVKVLIAIKIFNQLKNIYIYMTMI